MKKPDQIYPTSIKSLPSMMPPIIPDPSIKGISFDQLLNNRGIRFIHKRATPCPNLRGLDDVSHVPNCTICGQKGYLYYSPKEIFGVFQGNSQEKLFEQQGVWEVGSAVITFTAEYTDGTQADFTQFDQLVIADFDVRLYELKQYEPKTDNIQEVRYPITSIDHMSSVENGVLKVYQAGTDYSIVEGKIKWVQGHTPSYDSASQKGSVLTISYFANPTFSVIQVLRELRVTQELVNGQKVAKRLPQEVLVKRDYLVHAPETVG